MKNKKGISGVIVTVLLIVLAIVVVGIIYFVVVQFVGEPFDEGGILGNATFEIQEISEEDILFDRFRLKNFGEATLTSYVVKINGIEQDLIMAKIIEPQENEYLYLKNVYPAGEIILSVESGGFTDSVTFTVEEGWHISFGDISVVDAS